MGSRSHAQKKAPDSTSTPVNSQLRSRPFAPPQTETTPQAELPDLQTQLENAQRFGHSFSKIAVSTPAVQAQPETNATQQRETPDLQTQLETAQRFGHSFSRMALTDSIEQARGKGEPLDLDTRQSMEQSFQSDFGNVRIHANPQADQLNRSIQSRAFTTGQDIFFKQGAYAPTSPQGKQLLGHELTHVVQQRSGKVATPQGSGARINADPALEAEADQLGAKAAQGRYTTPEGGDVEQAKTGQSLPKVVQQTKNELRDSDPHGVEIPIADQPLLQKDPLQTDPKDKQWVYEFLQSNPSWGSVKDQFISDTPTMQAFVDYRKWYVDEIIGILRATKYPGLIAKSVGSNDLSSDYDITVSTPGDGDDVEAVSDFNQMVKNEFGVQPGTLFDTNLYAKDFLRVEGNIKQDPTLKQDGDLDQPDDEMGKLSNLDQDVAALVKQRRFMNPVEWDKYTKAVVSSIKNSEERKAVLKQYEEADAIYQISAHELLANTKESLGKEKIDLSNVHLGKEEQEELNKLPTAARNMVEKQLMGAEELHLITHEDPDLILEQSNKLYVQRMRQVRQLQEQIKIVYGIPEEVQVLKAEVKKLLGEACFFAAEAYHSEGAVKHVVAGLQGDPNQQKAALEKLTPEHILQSYNEQLGDFLKDAVHYAAEPAGKMFYRSSKYLFRLFDAVNEIKKRKEFQGIVLAVGNPAELAANINDKLVTIRKGKAPYSTMDDTAKNAAAVEFVAKTFGVNTSEGLKQLVLKMSVEFNQQVRNIVSSVADQKESEKYFKHAQIGNSDRK